MRKQAKQHRGGRPRRWTAEAIAGEAEALLEWIERRKGEGKPLWLGAFAVERGFPRQRLSEWAAEHPGTFGAALARAQSEQEADLVQGALAGRYHASMTIFALKNNHGWKDRQEIDNTHTHKHEILPADEGRRVMRQMLTRHVKSLN